MNKTRRTPALAATLATLLTSAAVAGEKITRLTPPEHVIPNLTRMVVVELNGDALAPSEFAQRALHAGDRLEIVKIVAGG